MATKMKKTLSLALALIMVLGMLPLTAFAEENTPSGVGSTWVDVESGNVIAEKDHINSNKVDGVTTEKTAKRTNNENEFEIQLEVTTKENLEQLQIAPDAAVVLVVDTSGSMKESAGTGADGKDISRMKSVQNILANNTDSFLNKYADVQGAENVRRMVAIVNFASDAAVKEIGGQYWANVAVEAGLQSAKGVINNFSAKGGTNIEGGLQLAYNLLTDSTLSADVNGITNRYVILLTDGVPTYHLDKKTNSTSATSFTGAEGGRTEAELEDYQDIPGIADGIKDPNKGNAKLQAVAYGNVSSETIYTKKQKKTCDEQGWHHHDWSDRNKYGYGDGKFGRIKDGTFEEYQVGMTDCENGHFDGPHTGSKKVSVDVTVKDWLTDVVKINDLYTPANAGSLAEDFANIVENIQKLAQAWIVTDPMGADVEYVADSADKKAPLVGFENGTLTWYMMKDNPEADGKGNYTYTLTYRVKLLNEKQGFADGKENLHPTNGQTTLQYVVKTNDVLGELTPIDFYVPTVWGTLPTVPYTIEYYKQNKDTGKYEIKDTSGPVDAKLHSVVNIADVDSGYQTKYESSGYRFDHGDTSITLTSTTGNVMRIYYVAETTAVTVNHYYKTVYTNAAGETTTIEYGDPTIVSLSSTESAPLYVGHEFEATLLTNDYDGLDETKENNQKITLKKNAAENVINLYYIKTTDDSEAKVVVNHKLITNGWELKDGKYEPTKSEITNPFVSATVLLKDGKTYSTPLTEAGFNYVSAASTTDDQVAVSESQATIDLKVGANDLTLTFEKNEPKPAAVNMTVNHHYTLNEYTIVDGALTVEPTVTTGEESETVSDYAVNEKFTVSEKNTYDGVTYDSDSGNSDKLTGTVTEEGKIIDLYYTKTVYPAQSTVTVNHIYRDWKTITNDDGVEEIVQDTVKHQPVSVTYPPEGETLYSKQYVTIEQKGLVGYSFNEGDSDLSAAGLVSVEAAGQTINLYYDAQPIDNRDATVTINHVYVTKLTTIVDGKVGVKMIQDGTNQVALSGIAGESYAIDEILTHGTNEYACTTEHEATKTYKAGTNADITLQYERASSDLASTTYSVVYKYQQKTMTINENGEAGYWDAAESVVVPNVGYTVTENTYKGQKVTLNPGDLTVDGVTYQQKTAPAIEQTLGEDDNVFEFVYEVQNPLPQHSVTVNHHWTLTEINEVGHETVTTTDSETPSVISAYEGAKLTILAKKNGYVFRESMPVVVSENLLGFTRDETTGDVTVTSANQNGTVDFYYTRTEDHSKPVSYTVEHYYRTLNWDGTVASDYARDGDGATASSYVTLTVTGTPNLKADDQGAATYDLDKCESTADEGKFEQKGYKLTLDQDVAKNIIRFYYTNRTRVDTRVPVQVQVIHSYYLLDENAPGGLISEGEYTTTANTVAAGAYVGANYVAAQRRENGEDERAKTYDADAENVYAKVLTATVEDNVIRLKYTRAYGDDEGFPVSGRKTYVGLNPDQYPITTVYLSQAGVQKYSAIVDNGPDGHGDFLFGNVAPGVYDISESASVAGYSYTAKYELTAQSYGQEVPSPQLRALVQGTVDITSNPQITVVAKMEYNLEITNTYTRNPAPTPDPDPTPGTTYYGITVKYVDEAGKELSAAHTERHYEGYSYDVTDKTTLEIADYTIKSVTGDTLAGRLNGDKVITVVYAPVVVIPDEKIPEGGKPGEVILPDTEPPKNELPEELEDGAVPLDAAPKTGDTATLWTTLMAVSGFGLAALAIFKGKKKEEDSAE